MYGMRMTILCLTTFLVASCARGDFCQVVKSEIVFDEETGRLLIDRARVSSEKIAVQNRYGRKHCDWD